MAAICGKAFNENVTAADFGLARELSDEWKRASRLSRRGGIPFGGANMTAVAGTPFYIAPEIVEAELSGRVS